MCFTCGPARVVKQPDFAIIYTRVADEWTRPDDLDLDPVESIGFYDGHWCYVGLCATLMDSNNIPRFSETLYGIPETPQSPCAFDNELASRWVTHHILDRASVPDPSTQPHR